MADTRENLQEGQRRRRSNKTESRSIKETEEQIPDIRPIGSWRRSYERNDWGDERDSRSWAENREYEKSGRIPYHKEEPCADIRENRQQQRLRDAEMQQRRSHETESRSMPHKKREYEHSGLRYNEPVQIRYHNESYIRDNIQQQRVRDSEMQQRRSHETESRFQQQRVRDYEIVQSESVYPKRPRKKDCPFYVENGWCGYGDCFYNHPKFFSVPDSPMRQDSTMDDRASGSTCEYSGLRYNEPVQIRDHNESYIRDNIQQQIVRESEMQQRRSHETESRFQQQRRARVPDWARSESRRRFDETEQSSVYPKRPRIKDCPFHIENGWCGYEDCFYNHPKFFSAPDSPMRQARTMDYRASGSTWGFDEEGYETEKMARTADWRGSGSTWRFNEGSQRRQETESGYMPDNMNVVHSQERIIRDTRDREPRQRHYGNDWVVNLEKKHNRSFPHICDEIVSGYLLKEERQRENTERQRREAQEDAQERRRRDTNLRQRRFEKKMREAREPRLMEIPVVNHNVDAHGQHNLQEQRQRENIEWQRRGTRENVQRDIEMEQRKDEESFNHPPTHAAKGRRKKAIRRGKCMFFKKGNCMNGSSCRFYHPMDTAATTSDVISIGTESSSMAEKRLDEQRDIERQSGKIERLEMVWSNKD